MTQRIRDIAFLLFLTLCSIGGGVFLFRSCRPAPSPVVVPAPTPSPQLQAASKTTSSTTASQSIRITIRLPQSGLKNQTSAQTSPLGAEIQYPRSGQMDENRTDSYNPVQDEEIVIELGQGMTSTSSGEASASVLPVLPPQPEERKSEDFPIGIIAGTMPGVVALDYRALQLGPLGVDLEANHRQVGAGISIGTKAFGVGGVYQGFDGGCGVFVGVGVRF